MVYRSTFVLLWLVRERTTTSYFCEGGRLRLRVMFSAVAFSDRHCAFLEPIWTLLYSNLKSFSRSTSRLFAGLNRLQAWQLSFPTPMHSDIFEACSKFGGTARQHTTSETRVAAHLCEGDLIVLPFTVVVTSACLYFVTPEHDNGVDIKTALYTSHTNIHTRAYLATHPSYIILHVTGRQNSHTIPPLSAYHPLTTEY